MSFKITLGLISIKILHKQVLDEPEYEIGNVFKFDMSGEAKIDKEKNLITQLVHVIIIENIQGRDLAFFKASFSFHIDKINEVVWADDDGTLKINKDLNVILRTASISTMRGIIWSELQGTYLQRAVMPVIDAASMEE